MLTYKRTSKLLSIRILIVFFVFILCFRVQTVQFKVHGQNNYTSHISKSLNVRLRFYSYSLPKKGYGYGYIRIRTLTVTNTFVSALFRALVVSLKQHFLESNMNFTGFSGAETLRLVQQMTEWQHAHSKVFEVGNRQLRTTI